MTSSSTNQTSNFLSSIHVVRFIAAASVVLFHLKRETGYMGYSLRDIGFIRWESGVDIFFIISGFIMYFICHDKFGNRGYIIEFFIARLIRIVPLYWLFTTCAILMIVFASNHLHNTTLSWLRIFGSYFFIAVPSPLQKFFPILGVGWTLNFEMFFYVLFGISLALPKVRAMWLVFSVIICLSLYGFITRTDTPLLEFYTQPIMLEFLVGIIFAKLYTGGMRFTELNRILLFSCSIILFLALPRMVETELYSRFIWAGIPSLFLVASFVMGRDFRQSNATKILVSLGASSYSLYLSHVFSLRVVTMVWQHFSLPFNALYATFSFVFAIFAGYLCYKFVENPILHISRRVSRLT